MTIVKSNRIVNSLLHLRMPRYVITIYLQSFSRSYETALIIVQQTDSTALYSQQTWGTHAQQYLLPAIPHDLIADQFAFRPSGSTTAALTFLVHHVTKFLEDCNYVRVLLIDYSKAFDSVNHEILAAKLKALPIPPFVLNWIINFLIGRTQSVYCDGTM